MYRAERSSSAHKTIRNEHSIACHGCFVYMHFVDITCGLQDENSAVRVLYM
jgi:hypothetical protein